jgi:hypothetical protein
MKRPRSFAAALGLPLAALLLAAAPAATAQQKKDASSDPGAASLVRAFEDKLNLEGLDITNIFTWSRRRLGRPTGSSGSRSTAGTPPTPSP